jgi:hypothetical protein
MRHARSVTATGPAGLHRFDTTRTVLGIAAGLTLTLAAAVLIAVGFDPSVLVHAAPPWTDPDLTPPSLTVLGDERGYDGQFFYRLAIDPWSTMPTISGVTLDVPGMRTGRIGFPLLAFALSGSVDSAVPWALLVVNLLALTALAVIGAQLAHRSGIHRCWGLAFLLWPGFAYTLTHDLSELTAAALVLAALLAARGERTAWAALLLAAAALTRETTLLVAAGLVVAGLWRWWRRGDRNGPVGCGLTAGAVAGAAFLVAQLVGWVRLGALPIAQTVRMNAAGSTRTGSDTGVLHAIVAAFPPRSGSQLLTIAAMALLAAMLVIGALGLRRSSSPAGEKVAWLFAAVLLFSLNGNPWAEPKSFLRATTEFGVLTVLLAFGLPARWPRVLLAGGSSVVAAGALYYLLTTELPTLAALGAGAG